MVKKSLVDCISLILYKIHIFRAIVIIVLFVSCGIEFSGFELKDLSTKLIKPGFHIIVTIARIATIAEIMWLNDPSDHMETLSSDPSDLDRRAEEGTVVPHKCIAFQTIIVFHVTSSLVFWSCRVRTVLKSP